MLTYHYALISDPCERTVNAFLDYARAHPACLLTLTPTDSRDMQRAIATAWSGHEHEFAGADEEYGIALDGSALN
ncbi:MAG TPA: hypothetical protein VFE63_00095 [Roseiarcus sp.]|jgi:hypothetical protein|nr:hypothetical protein [Roseiarcus sp.]